MSIEDFIKNKKGHFLHFDDYPKALSLCHTLFDLKIFFKSGGSLNALTKFLLCDRKTLRYLLKFSKEDYSIEELKNNFNEIMEKYKSEMEEYDKKKKKLAEQRKLYVCNGRTAAYEKNRNLVFEYELFKTQMCHNIGQKKVKLFLNKKIKQGDNIAELYRVALELENTNINAKKYKNTMAVSYKDNLYAQKEVLLKQLISLCLKYNQSNDNEIVFGYENADDYLTNLIIYFELPGMQQISFHCNLKDSDLFGVTKYLNDWDGLENSTLFKIESAILDRYGTELEK